MKRIFAVVVLLAAAPLVFAQSSGMKDMDMKGMDMKKPMPMMSDKGQVHKGTGVVKSVDPKKGTVTLTHEPIQSMNWPSMTMSFKAQDGKLVEGLTPGKKMEFEFIQQGKDNVITSVK
jgi:Cu(I)/Ag(I) efflux system periplasmic protein CusF